jgi:hypothetical protein
LLAVGDQAWAAPAANYGSLDFGKLLPPLSSVCHKSLINSQLQRDTVMNGDA